MWSYLWSVLGLALLCAGWVLFQRWLARVDPEGRRIEDVRSCGGGCALHEKACEDPETRCVRRHA